MPPPPPTHTHMKLIITLDESCFSFSEYASNALEVFDIKSQIQMPVIIPVRFFACEDVSQWLYC